MEHSLIQPCPVDDTEPTCVAALTIMAAHLGASREQVHLALTGCAIPSQAAAKDWESSLSRALDVLAHQEIFQKIV